MRCLCYRSLAYSLGNTSLQVSCDSFRWSLRSHSLKQGSANVRRHLIWFQFAHSWWSLVLSTFPLAFCLSGCLLSKCKHPPVKISFLKMPIEGLCLFLIGFFAFFNFEFYGFFMYFGYQLLIRYIVCKYSLPFSRLPFILFMAFFVVEKFFGLM